MKNRTARTIEGLLYGAYVGKIKYLLDSDITTISNLLNETNNLKFMINIINSINKKEHICPADIKKRNNDNVIEGSILYAISPLAFSDIFGLHHEMDEVVKNVVEIANSDENTQMLCVEYIHLLHDILWFKVNKNDILTILPELDVLESEVMCSTDEKDIFFAALWSFIFSNDYISCYEKASSLSNTNSDITGIACTFAGLYYGIDSIPTDWSVQVFEEFETTDKVLILPML